MGIFYPSSKTQKTVVLDRLGEAFAEAERIIKKLKAGEIKFEETAANLMSVLVVPRNGGDLGWQDETHFHVDFAQRCQSNRDRYYRFSDFPSLGVHVVPEDRMNLKDITGMNLPCRRR